MLSFQAANEGIATVDASFPFGVGASVTLVDTLFFAYSKGFVACEKFELLDLFSELVPDPIASKDKGALLAPASALLDGVLTFACSMGFVVCEKLEKGDLAGSEKVPDPRTKGKRELP